MSESVSESVPAAPAASGVRRPVIAIAGLAIETSTFTPTRTHAPAFHPDRGDEVVARYPFLASYADRADFRGALIGHALPGGMVDRDSYESLATEICDRLAAIVADGAVDGLWYDIHGAMVVEGLDDAETDLLGRIRAVVGPGVVVSASMDLHGNVTAELAHQVDLVTCYRMAPHEDALETKERAVRNLVDVLTTRPVGEQRPVKAWVPIPVLLPGEQTSTRIEPAASLYAQVPEVEATPGVLDAAIWVGYAWADQPRDRAVTVVTGGTARPSPRAPNGSRARSGTSARTSCSSHRPARSTSASPLRSRRGPRDRTSSRTRATTPPQAAPAT